MVPGLPPDAATGVAQGPLPQNEGEHPTYQLLFQAVQNALSFLLDCPATLEAELIISAWCHMEYQHTPL